jgi:chemotaxis protein MotB
MHSNQPPFVIKKIKKTAHAHHGGAWKIAYADFVTAMMAFFLLLWLISMTTPQQKKGIADYFAPPNVSESTSGAGGVLGGTAYDNQSAKMSGSATDATTFTSPDSPRKQGPMVATRGGRQDLSGNKADAGKTATANLDATFSQDFQSAAASIRQAWAALPDITSIADNLVLEQTDKGLNIKIMDRAGRPMFPEGSKFPYDATRKAVAVIAPLLQKMQNQIVIAGYTPAGVNYTDPKYGAWELSMDRADAIRQVLGEFGLSDDHVKSVAGYGTNDPLFPGEPYLAGNSRVEITLLNKAPPVPPGLKP